MEFQLQCKTTMQRPIQENPKPEGMSMLSSQDNGSFSDRRPPSSNRAKNQIFHICANDVMEDTHVFQSHHDLQSPGDLSQGQFSLGVESTVSGHSDNSRTGLLGTGNGRTEGVDNNIIFEDDDDDDEDNVCRIGRFSPPCFLMCANIKMFVSFMCALIVVASALTTGYLNSVITTIEKR